MENSIQTLVPRIEAFCKSKDMAETTFGAKAVNDGKLVNRLRSGGTVTLKTFLAIEDFLSANGQGATTQ